MQEQPAGKKLRPLVTLLVFFALPSAAVAQLYMWKDTEGKAVIKNTPPSWYKESERSHGARVQVLRNGKVIDDTAWSPDKRQEGRSADSREEDKRARTENAALPAKKNVEKGEK